jgi:acyl-CoA thioester hydrolase/1,4-dihydroxy-2-naphthoyl-CoA hydrolase
MARALYTKTLQLRFRHADPAGLLFFGNVYKIAHDTYEDFIQDLGFEWQEWFDNKDCGVPIRHSSAEHLLPLEPSKVYKIEVWVERIGKSSFTLRYAFVDDQHLYCEVRLVHTFYNKALKTKMSIPSDIYDRLETYRRECVEAE